MKPAATSNMTPKDSYTLRIAIDVPRTGEWAEHIEYIEALESDIRGLNNELLKKKQELQRKKMELFNKR